MNRKKSDYGCGCSNDRKVTNPKYVEESVVYGRKNSKRRFSSSSSSSSSSGSSSSERFASGRRRSGSPVARYGFSKNGKTSPPRMYSRSRSRSSSPTQYKFPPKQGIIRNRTSSRDYGFSPLAAAGLGAVAGYYVGKNRHHHDSLGYFGRKK